jgi:hypothetical protein
MLSNNKYRVAQCETLTWIIGIAASSAACPTATCRRPREHNENKPRRCQGRISAFSSILIDTIPSSCACVWGVFHVPACLCEALLGALACFSITMSWRLQHCACRSGQRLWRIGRSLRIAHSERRASELRGYDGGASHLAVRHSRSGVP